MSTGECVEKTSKLYQLCPFLGRDGLMRIQERIDKADCIDFETKRPIILPRQHYVTMLVVRRCHEKYHHINHETVDNELRSKFYIPQLRQLLNTVNKYSTNVVPM